MIGWIILGIYFVMIPMTYFGIVAIDYTLHPEEEP